MNYMSYILCFLVILVVIGLMGILNLRVQDQKENPDFYTVQINNYYTNSYIQLIGGSLILILILSSFITKGSN